MTRMRFLLNNAMPASSARTMNSTPSRSGVTRGRLTIATMSAPHFRFPRTDVLLSRAACPGAG